MMRMPDDAPELAHARELAPPPPPPRNFADDVFAAMRRRWGTIAAIAILATVLAWIAAAMQPKKYRAIAMGAVTPIAELTSSEMIRGVDTLERRVVVASVAALASAPATTHAAQAGNYDVTAIVLPNTNLFNIEVEGANPREAAAIANRVTPILSRQSRAMFRVYGVTLLSPAPVPSAPVLPRVGRAAATGLFFGILIGIAVAYLLHQRRGV
jgi:uncharacterized protein involved in exopolysaccharide biosynthesis